MGIRKCSINNCSSRSGQGISLFTVPKNISDRQKWNKKFNQVFTDKCHVCELHLPAGPEK